MILSGKVSQYTDCSYCINYETIFSHKIPAHREYGSNIIFMEYRNVMEFGSVRFTYEQARSICGKLKLADSL